MKMNLVIFDIDGTLLNSVKTDDECFIQTIDQLYNIDLSESNWADFKNVTDLGLTNEIIEKHFKRLPSNEEVVSIKKYFYNLLSERKAEFKEIAGAIKFIEYLHSIKSIKIAIATGGWKETALLKTNSIGLDLNEIVMKTSNDHYNRAEIIKLAIEDSLVHYKVKEFETITYIGDGIWDYKTAAKLGIQFIGLDATGNGNLEKIGAELIFPDFQNSNEIVKSILH